MQRRWTSGEVTTKSVSIKSAGCRFGGCALKAVSHIAGGLSYRRRSVVCPGIGTESGATHSDPAAEVISGHSSRASGEGPNGRKRQVGGATR